MNEIITRRRSRQITAGELVIGGNAPVSVQTMATVPIERTAECIAQVNELTLRGAQLVRLAVRNMNEARLVGEIVRATHVPLCADIHFDYRLALAAIEGGIHKVRINPGNIGSLDRVREVARAARERSVPIRIGVNGGSLDRNLYPAASKEAMCESALSHISLLEKCSFNDIALSLKSSDLRMTVEANRMMASRVDYPLHIGLTEAGYGMACLIQSGAAIGSLLLDGIGDTIRISMSGDPRAEVDAGIELLRSLGIISCGVKMIACPTCGRAGSADDIEPMARAVHEAAAAKFSARLKEKNRMLVLAVMGCEVNGPGEAAHADAGLAGAGPGKFLLFVQGKSRGIVGASGALAALIDAAEEIL